MLSIIIVVALSEISKRVNPRIAGIIAGLPLGTGLSVYFISLEQGVKFAMKGVPWGIAGLAGALIFCFVYLVASKMKMTRFNIVDILVSSVLGVAAFLLTGYCISEFRLNLLAASIVFFAVFLVNLGIVPKIIGKPDKSPKSKSNFAQYVMRGIVVGGILLLITSIAPLIGSKWANILSSFPSTLFPLLIILHFDEGDRLFPFVIFGFSTSITTLYVFYLLYAFVVPIVGLNIGFLIIYALCGCYLFVLQKIQNALLK